MPQGIEASARKNGVRKHRCQTSENIGGKHRCQTYTFDKIAFFTCDGIVKSVGLTPTRSDPNEIHSVILGSREFVDEIKERFLRGKQPDRELAALRREHGIKS
jgi:hypothetical protein